MADFVIKELKFNNIETELKSIGFDESYYRTASKKFKYKNLKIFDLTPAQANILKQTALSCGADCATHREVITGNIKTSDVILGGSNHELTKIAEKLKSQPFKLSKLSDEIISLINNKKQNVTKLVGILNITPDSFSDGGKYFEPVNACNHILTLIDDGADIIDIGAESTKPFSEGVCAKEQIRRLKPVLKFIQNENLKIPVSIDTRSSEVADFALNTGASIINDISGFDFDNKMPNIVSKYGAGIIIQHSKGTPDTMQIKPAYNNLIEEIFFALLEKIQIAENNNIKNIIIDPGIGFGKTKENNFEILDRIEELYTLNKPVMVGISRKSFLGITDNNDELKDSLSAALSYPLITKNVDFLRVHNVKLHKQLLNTITF